jgi:cystathionine beta-lyase/cystathionine gamma-synthase
VNKLKTYPLKSLNIEQAKKLQFKMIDSITKNFQGHEILSRGDLGVVMGQNKPTTTIQVEKTIADFFDAEDAILLRGSGTGALRWGLISFINNNEKLLVHDAPIYPTTEVTLNTMGVKTIKADFNDINDIKEKIEKNPDIKGALIQHSRQKIEDSYDLENVIKIIKNEKNIPIIIDDNYAIMKTQKMGTQCGAELSAFSTFKLLGPEGVGCLVGKKELIQKVKNLNYSGGSQVQGHEAMDVIYGLIYAPVSLAIQAEVNDELVKRLNNNEVPHIKNAFLANAQSKVLLVEFDENIAYDVLKEAEKLGAIPHPVGSESKYEFAPMFYRISGTFRAADPELENRMIRINPMRSGADTIIRILNQSINKISKR